MLEFMLHCLIQCMIDLNDSTNYQFIIILATLQDFANTRKS